VLREACRQWRDLAGVRASRRCALPSMWRRCSFDAGDLFEVVRGALQASELDPRFLEIELTGKAPS